MNFLTIVSLFCSGTAALQSGNLLPNVRARYIEESGFDDRAPKIGYTYSSYTNNKPYFATFGTVTRFDSKEVGKVSKKVRQGWWLWDITNRDFPTHAYAVYKYSYKANSGNSLIDENTRHLLKGQTTNYSKTFTEGTENVYSNTVTTTVAGKFGLTTGFQASGDIYGVKLTGSVSQTTEISASISSSVTHTASDYYQAGKTFTESYTAPEDCYVRYQQRATFEIYCIQSYSINYTSTQTTTYDNGYRNYRYTYTPSYTLDEQIIKFVYIDNSVCEGFFKQKLNDDGTFEYDGEKLNNTLYF